MRRCSTTGAAVWVMYEGGVATVDSAAHWAVRFLQPVFHLAFRKNMGCSNLVPVFGTKPPAGLLISEVYAVLDRLQHTLPRMQGELRGQRSSLNTAAGKIDTKALLRF